MTTQSRFESVGWIFFAVAWILSLFPVGYMIFQATLDSTPIATRCGATFFRAGFVAAILSWLANSILGMIADRRVDQNPKPAPLEEQPVSSEETPIPVKKKKKKKKK
jgi:hypothetical protein